MASRDRLVPGVWVAACLAAAACAPAGLRAGAMLGRPVEGPVTLRSIASVRLGAPVRDLVRRAPPAGTEVVADSAWQRAVDEAGVPQHWSAVGSLHGGLFARLTFPMQLGRPCALDGRVFVPEWSGALWAVEASAGRVVWRARAGDALAAGCLADEGRVYVGGLDGTVSAFDARTGRRVWSYRMGPPVREEPALGDGVVYVAAERGLVVALDASDGKLQWSAKHESAVYGQLSEVTLVTGHGAPVVDGDRVYVGFDDGILAAYDASDGTQRWQVDLGGRASKFRDIDGPVLAVGGRVFAASHAGGLWCVDASDGHALWHASVDGAGPPAQWGDLVYTSDVRGHVRAYWADSGELAWTARLTGPRPGRLVLAGGLLLTTTGHALEVLSAADGLPVERWPSVEGIQAPALIEADARDVRVAAWTDDGVLHLLSVAPR